MEDDAVDGFGDDPDAGGEHDEGLDEGGERFDLAVAVVVVFVGGTVGDLDGEQGDDGGDEVDAGMRGFAEHAERAGEKAGEQFEQGDDAGGEDGENGGRALGGVGLLRLASRMAVGLMERCYMVEEGFTGIGSIDGCGGEWLAACVAAEVEHDGGVRGAWGCS